MTDNKRLLFPLAAGLLLAVTALSTPVAAHEHGATAYVYFEGGRAVVVPPPGWTCSLTKEATTLVDALGVPISLGERVELRCEPDAPPQDSHLVPQCGTVTAGVTGQSGGIGHTTAAAICGASGQAVCQASYLPVLGAQDCAISITGSGPASCAWTTTVNVNYNRIGSCNFPAI